MNEENNMKKYLYIIGLTFVYSLSAMAQELVTGVVKDASGNPLSGVKVSQVGESRHNVVTDQDGAFSLTVGKGDYVELNYMDLLMKRVKVEGEKMDKKSLIRTITGKLEAMDVEKLEKVDEYINTI